MAVDLEKHSEPKPLENAAPVYSHPAHDPIRRSSVPDTEELLNDLDDKVHNVLAQHEGRVLGPNDVEGIKLQLHRQSDLIGSVGVSMIDDVATVAIQVLLRGVESWIHAKFPAMSVNNVVNTSQDVDDGGQPKPAMMRGGKSTTGIKGSAPYAEVPERKEGE